MALSIQQTSRKTTGEDTVYLVNGDMSATIECDVVDIKFLDRMSAQLHWTGTPVGVVSVQISNDKLRWTTMPLTVPVNPAGSEDDAIIDIETSARYLRIVYTFTSGVGVLNINLFGKSLSH